MICLFSSLSAGEEWFVLSSAGGEYSRKADLHNSNSRFYNDEKNLH